MIEAMKSRAHRKIMCLVWSRSAEHTFFSHINFRGPPAAAEYPPSNAAHSTSLRSALQLYKSLSPEGSIHNQSCEFMCTVNDAFESFCDFPLQALGGFGG